jgi:hypothetical protein
MARMTPAQRLELLKEVGGTRVYEERRKESIKIMGETEARRTQVRSCGSACGLCCGTGYAAFCMFCAGYHCCTPCSGSTSTCQAHA